VSKLQDKGKDVPELHTATNHEGVRNSGDIIQIMLSRDNKRKGVIPRPLTPGESGHGITQQEAQQNPQRVWTFWERQNFSMEPTVGLDVRGRENTSM